MGEFSAVARFRTGVISFHRSTLGSVRGFFDRTFYVVYTDTFLRVANAGEWRCRSDLGGVRGGKTSGRTSKARNEAVAIAG